MTQDCVRVTHLFGAGTPIAFMNPRVDMRGKHGQVDYFIQAVDSGNKTISVALSSGGSPVKKLYSHQFFINPTTASGYGYPAATDVIPAQKSATTQVAPGSGMSYFGGDGLTHLFSR